MLSISVLSYNRPEKLRRVFNSLEKLNTKEISIDIYDDNSPSRKEIERIVNEYKKNFSCKITLTSHNQNLGYDANLIYALKNSYQKFVMLLSDDDYVDEEHILSLLNHLEESNPSVCVTPFKRSNRVYRTQKVKKLNNYNLHVLYDSILFSGLIFKASNFTISKKEEFELSKSIYSQVYLVAKHWDKESTFYDKPIIILGEDGENYFGVSDSTQDQSDLADRSDPLSNLKYQKRLANVVSKIESELSIKIYNTFKKSLNLRLIGHFFKVRSKHSFTDYLKIYFEFQRINHPSYFLINICIFFIAFLPSFMANLVYSFTVHRFRKSGG